MTIPYSAGMIPRGAFYNAPGLMRYGSGGQQDPLAALIGNALGTYQSATEKQQADARDQQQIDDAKNYRTTQAQLEAYKAGLAPISPPDTSPQTTGSTQADQALNLDPFTPPPAGPKPVMTIGGTPYARDVGRELAKPDIHEGPNHSLYSFDAQGHPTLAVPGEPATKQPGYHVIDGQYVPDVPGTGRAQPVPGFVPPDQNKVTPKQRETAEFGAGALAAWKQLDQERTNNPQVEQEVGKIMTTPAFVQALPGIKSSSDMMTALQKAGASPSAQRYMRAKWSELDNIVRTRIPGGRMSGALFTQMQGELMPGLDEQGNDQIHQNEIQAILTAQGESDYDNHPEIWDLATKRHGVDQIDLQDVLQGGHGDKRMKAIRGRY